MQFKARLFNVSSGVVTERTLEAGNAEELAQQMQREGLTILSVTAVKNPYFTAKKSNFNVVLFCEELKTLLSSGMSLVEAIDTLCTKKNAIEQHNVLTGIKQKLLEGKPLSSTLELSQFPFPSLLIASIRASEKTSLIEQALEEYVAYEKVGQELGKKIASAAIYPSLVVGFGFLVCLFMISYVVPRFSKVYEDFSHTLSTSTRILIKLGQLAGDHTLLLLTIVVGICFSLFISYRNGKLKILFLFIVSQFKFVQYYLRLYQLARIYQTISMLLKGGYTLADAIPLSQNLAFEKPLQNQLCNMRTSVMEGKRLSTAFADNGLTDNVTERLLQVGERSGNLPKVLDIIAHNYRQEFTRFIEQTTKLAEPILLMAVGIMIGAIIILMYMPVFDLAGGI